MNPVNLPGRQAIIQPTGDRTLRTGRTSKAFSFHPLAHSALAIPIALPGVVCAFVALRCGADRDRMLVRGRRLMFT